MGWKSESKEIMRTTYGYYVSNCKHKNIVPITYTEFKTNEYKNWVK